MNKKLRLSPHVDAFLTEYMAAYNADVTLAHAEGLFNCTMRLNHIPASMIEDVKDALQIEEIRLPLFACTTSITADDAFRIAYASLAMNTGLW